MNYKLKILLSGIVFLSFSFCSESELDSTINGNAITVENLSKKWILVKYKYLIFSENPSEKEKDDFLHFSSDMTYTSISEREFDEGEWTLDVEHNKIHLTAYDEEGVLTFLIDKITSNQLVLIIDDPTDVEAKNLKIIFESE